MMKNPAKMITIRGKFRAIHSAMFEQLRSSITQRRKWQANDPDWIRARGLDDFLSHFLDVFTYETGNKMLGYGVRFYMYRARFISL